MRAWTGDCTTILGYMPTSPPVREDHKRLLMLLHDLCASLQLWYLLGILPAPIVLPHSLGELASFIISFGETNRKTALSTALALAAASFKKHDEALAQLEAFSLCDDVGPQDSEPDLWQLAGARLCPTLLLRAGREKEALANLKRRISQSPTMHTFISAFEIAARVTHPPVGSSVGDAEAPPLLFLPHQMLEVLDAGLQHPQHNLASEAHLLRWQLVSSLSFGQAEPRAPPLACPPPTAAPLIEAPRILILMPMVASEQERLRVSLGRWKLGGGFAPCEPSEGAERGTIGGAAPIDLMLYLADPPGKSTSAWFKPAEFLGSAALCFDNVLVRYGNFSREQQHYQGGWDNTGPNNLFYSAFFDETLAARYDLLFWMETDVFPVAPSWLDRLREEAVLPRGFWRKGPAQQPDLDHAMVSTHHAHMNSVGFYRLGDSCFNSLMRRVQEEHPLQPHDVSTHLFLHNARHFHIFQRVAHRFLYTDLVQNRLDEWDLARVSRVSADTVLVHGKHVAGEKA